MVERYGGVDCGDGVAERGGQLDGTLCDPLKGVESYGVGGCGGVGVCYEDAHVGFRGFLEGFGYGVAVRDVDVSALK